MVATGMTNRIPSAEAAAGNFTPNRYAPPITDSRQHQRQPRRTPPGHHRRHAAHRAPPPGRREPVETIRTDLIIPTGKRKGHNPSLASTYRALAEHDKAQAYPEAIEKAPPAFAALPS